MYVRAHKSIVYPLDLWFDRENIDAPFTPRPLPGETTDQYNARQANGRSGPSAARLQHSFCRSETGLCGSCHGKHHVWN